MMNLGVPGVVAVGSNITHKFGKAMVGSRKHSELGNVDKRLGMFLIATSFMGIQVAVWINSALFEASGDGHGAGGSAKPGQKDGIVAADEFDHRIAFKPTPGAP